MISLEITLTLLLSPASRAMSLITTVPSNTSWISSSNNLFKKPASERDTAICGPCEDELTSAKYTLTASPVLNVSSPILCLSDKITDVLPKLINV